jgi:hypothetical protein
MQSFKYSKGCNLIMQKHIIKKQKARGHCLLSVPKELAKKMADIEFFQAKIDEDGCLRFEPIEI